MSQSSCAKDFDQDEIEEAKILSTVDQSTKSAHERIEAARAIMQKQQQHAASPGIPHANHARLSPVLQLQCPDHR